MGGLSIVVGAAAVGTGVASYALRRALPAPVVLALGQAAITGMVISIASSDAFCDRTAWLLGKDRKTGQFHPWALPIFWPFFLGLHYRITARRNKTTEPLYNKVFDGWYVGGWPHIPESLPSGDIAVVDCTSEFSKTHDSPYICVPSWDTQGVSSDLHAEAVDFALEQRALGRSVLIHCAHGHGRSVGVMCACLVMAGHFATYQEALKAQQRARPKARLNKVQTRYLEEYLKRQKKIP